MTWSAPRSLDQLRVGAAAHAGHLGAEVLGQLHGHRADRTRGAVDQYRTRPAASFPSRKKCSAVVPPKQRATASWWLRRLGDLGDRTFLGHGDVFGVAAEVETAREATTLSPGWKLVTAFPTASTAGHLEAEDGLLRLGDAELQPHRQAQTRAGHAAPAPGRRRS